MPACSYPLLLYFLQYARHQGSTFAKILSMKNVTVYVVVTALNACQRAPYANPLLSGQATATAQHFAWNIQNKICKFRYYLYLVYRYSKRSRNLKEPDRYTHGNYFFNTGNNYGNRNESQHRPGYRLH